MRLQQIKEKEKNMQIHIILNLLFITQTKVHYLNERSSILQSYFLKDISSRIRSFQHAIENNSLSISYCLLYWLIYASLLKYSLDSFI